MFPRSVSSYVLSRLFSRFHAELQTDWLVVLYAASSVQCQSQQCLAFNKTSLNTAITRGTQTSCENFLILPPQLHDTVIKMFQWWSQDTTCNRALNCRVTDDLEYEERSVWSNFSLLSTSSQTVNWGTCFFYLGVRHIKMSIKQLKKHPDSVYLSDIDVTFRVWAQ